MEKLAHQDSRYIGTKIPCFPTKVSEHAKKRGNMNNLQTTLGLRYTIKFYASLPEADFHLFDMVISNRMSLKTSLQFYSNPSVMPGFGIFG